MLDREQMDNWDGVSENLIAAVEYNRRCLKGLPSDRWADGKVGETRVALGIGEMEQAIANLYAENVSLKRAEKARGADAMAVHVDPMR